MNPIKLVVALIRAFLMMLLVIVFLAGYGITLLFKRHTTSRAFTLRRNYMRFLKPILNIRFEEQIGEMHDGPALYVSNHRSFMDPFVASCFVEAYIIAKAEVASIPIINIGAQATGIIYVKREERKSRAATRALMIETLKSGHNILIYPEGTVGVDAHTLPFKPGSFRAIAEHNIPVVPIALEYRCDYSFWRTPSLFKHFVNHAGSWVIPCKLSIGKAMYHEDGSILRDQVEAWVNGELKRMQAGWSEVFV